MLEIARTEPMTNVAQVRSLLATFKECCAEYEIPTLNERNNKPEEYCALYEKRFVPNEKADNLARGAVETYLKTLAERYRSIATTAMTDGLHGGEKHGVG